MAASILTFSPRRWRERAAITALGAVLLSGCAVLTSQSPLDLVDGGRPATGVHYALPRSTLKAALWVDADTSTFYVVMDEPVSIPDPAHRYYLQYRPRANYDDDISITVGSKGLLKTVSSKTEDKTSEIILNLVKGAVALPGILEAADLPTKAQQLQQMTLDPADEDDVRRVVVLFNKTVRDFAKKRAEKLCVPSGNKQAQNKASQENAKKEDTESEGGLASKGRAKDAIGEFVLDVGKNAQCDALKAILKEPNHISIKARSAQGGAQSKVRHRPDCRVGICYRPPLPFTIELRVGDSVDKRTVLIPNKASPVEIDIERAFFVNKFQLIEFDDNGYLKKMQVSKDSELYAISTLPVAVVEAITHSLRLRVGILNNRISHADSSRALINARAELEKQRARFESALAAYPARTTVSGVSIVPRITAPPPVQSSSAARGSFLDSVDAVDGLQSRQ